GMATTSTTTTPTARTSGTHRTTPTATQAWPIGPKSRSLSYAQAIIRLIRVRQWVKNLFLFIPSFFAGHLFQIDELMMVTAGALAFSFVASGVYVINDYRDCRVDRLHPKKKFRPLASG